MKTKKMKLNAMEQCVVEAVRELVDSTEYDAATDFAAIHILLGHVRMRRVDADKVHFVDTCEARVMVEAHPDKRKVEHNLGLMMLASRMDECRIKTEAMVDPKVRKDLEPGPVVIGGGSRVESDAMADKAIAEMQGGRTH